MIGGRPPCATQSYSRAARSMPKPVVETIEENNGNSGNTPVAKGPVSEKQELSDACKCNLREDRLENLTCTLPPFILRHSSLFQKQK
ncbi:hypothetical protein RB195_014036 [Necator americanus]|uniref:Uncharacterized protein n=1 Tax=Necator americanus TaxID=51031 RepID=A0ABR1DYH7_NECAM